MNTGLVILIIFLVVYLIILVIAAMMKKRASKSMVKTKSVFSDAKVVNNITGLNGLIELVDDFERANVAPKVIFDLHLALEELFVLIIDHTVTSKKDYLLIVRSLKDGFVFMTLKYRGMKYNPLEESVLDLDKPIEEISLEGLEIHLAKAMLDGCSYSREGGYNVLNIKKKII